MENDNCHYAEICLRKAEEHRRERGTLSTVPHQGVVDYGDACTLVQQAMHHLDEALPTGQRIRGREALMALTVGASALTAYMHAAGYFQGESVATVAPDGAVVQPDKPKETLSVRLNRLLGDKQNFTDDTLFVMVQNMHYKVLCAEQVTTQNERTIKELQTLLGWTDKDADEFLTNRVRVLLDNEAILRSVCELVDVQTPANLLGVLTPLLVQPKENATLLANYRELLDAIGATSHQAALDFIRSIPSPEEKPTAEEKSAPFDLNAVVVAANVKGWRLCLSTVKNPAEEDRFWVSGHSTEDSAVWSTGDTRKTAAEALTVFEAALPKRTSKHRTGSADVAQLIARVFHAGHSSVIIRKAAVGYEAVAELPDGQQLVGQDAANITGAASKLASRMLDLEKSDYLPPRAVALTELPGNPPAVEDLLWERLFNATGEFLALSGTPQLYNAMLAAHDAVRMHVYGKAQYTLQPVPPRYRAEFIKGRGLYILLLQDKPVGYLYPDLVSWNGGTHEQGVAKYLRALNWGAEHIHQLGE